MDEDLFNLAFLGLLPGELPRRDREVRAYLFCGVVGGCGVVPHRLHGSVGGWVYVWILDVGLSRPVRSV
jgi:hypothetical protein